MEAGRRRPAPPRARSGRRRRRHANYNTLSLMQENDPSTVGSFRPVSRTPDDPHKRSDRSLTIKRVSEVEGQMGPSIGASSWGGDDETQEATSPEGFRR